jgi:hypothetical protein
MTDLGVHDGAIQVFTMSEMRTLFYPTDSHQYLHHRREYLRHMTLHPEIFPTAPVRLLWMRLPFRAVLIGRAYRYTL